MRLVSRGAAVTLFAALMLSACSSGGGESDVNADISRPTEISADTVTKTEAEGEPELGRLFPRTTTQAADQVTAQTEEKAHA